MICQVISDKYSFHLRKPTIQLCVSTLNLSSVIKTRTIQYTQKHVRHWKREGGPLAFKNTPFPPVIILKYIYNSAGDVLDLEIND